MGKAMIVLAYPAYRAKAHHWIDRAKPNSRITFEGPKRSLDQNAAMWRLLTKVAEQHQHFGQRLTLDKPYLAWIRRQPCCVAHNGGCWGPVQAAHLRFSDASKGRVNPGLSVKPSDHLTTPLCAHHHQIQHGGRESAFWAVMGVDPAALCKILRAEYEAQP